MVTYSKSTKPSAEKTWRTLSLGNLCNQMFSRSKSGCLLMAESGHISVQLNDCIG
jgi:hypothetical protein